jgi:hypothetical protein
VLYARPFERSRGIETLTLQFLPRRFHDLHPAIDLLRDQTVAHADAQGALDRGLPANNVRLIVYEGQVQLGIQEVKFKLTAISEARELANVLVKRCSSTPISL